MQYLMLNESVNQQDILEQPFLKNHNGMILYHGTDSIDEPTKLDFRFRSKPMTTIKPLHNEINELSKEKYGIPVRNLLFVYPNRSDEVYMYGSATIVVPIGENYQLFYNPRIYDMTYDMGVSRYSDIPIKNITELLMELDDGTMGSYYKLYVDNLHEHGELRTNVNNAIIDTLKRMENDSDDNIMINVHLKNFIETNKNQISDIITNAFSDSIEQLARQYVNGLVELGKNKSVDDVELMVYAPDGFYVIPEHTKLFNTFYKG